VIVQQRVIAYIDGFNLYFGLKSKGWQRYYWLNLRRLIERLLKPRQRLVAVKYFTARVAGTPSNPDKPRRQSAYLDALQTLPDLRVFYGHYLLRTQKCRACGMEAQIPTEKMTDVKIAVELLADAFQNSFDVAMIVSADSDLVPPVGTVRRLFPGKSVIVAFPPNRSSVELRKVAAACFTIGRKKLADSQFPDRLRTASGYDIVRPEAWR